MVRVPLALVLVPALCVALAPEAAAQQRRAPFDAPVVLADEYSRFDRIGDLDGDGDVDAIGHWNWEWSSSLIRGKVRAFLNDGQGKLELAWTHDYQLPYSSYSQDEDAIGDLDGDGDADFVFRVRNRVWAVFSNGAASPTVVDLAGLGIEHLCIADFTGDGVADLATHGGIGFDLAVRSWDASTSSFVVVASRTCSCGADFVMPIECNGDGARDLAIGFFGSPTHVGMRLFPIVGGVIESHQSLGVSIDMPMVAPGDVDGDGDEDIAVFGMSTYKLLRRTGPTTYVEEPLVTGGPATNLVDVDGDGDLDGVCCGGSGGRSIDLNTGISILRVSHNDGTGRFAPAIEIPNVGAEHIAGVADMEGDGDMDLVAGRCVYYARGPIVATPMPPTGGEQSDRTCRDFDGDGDPDFSCTQGLVRMNLGDGTSIESIPMHALAPPPAVYDTEGFPGDFDGDGDEDLVVRRVQTGQPAQMAMLWNDGRGAFFDGGVVGPTSGAFTLAGLPKADDSLAGDLDGDGDVDLVTRNPPNFSATSRVWINSMPAGFEPGPTFAERALWIGDLTGDGLADLLSTPSASLNLRVGTGNGGFASPVALPASPWTGDRIAVADVDHDGDLDVAAVGIGTSGVPASQTLLLVNDGFGGFTQELLPLTCSHTSDFPGVASIFDVDGDGLVDLVFGSPWGARNGVAVLFRRADDTGWEDPVLQPCFTWDDGFDDLKSRHVVADADGDGDLDIVSDHVVRNRKCVLPTSGERRQLGEPVAGTAGVEPLLGASGPFRVGETCTVRVNGLRPSARGRLEIRDLDAPPPFAPPGLRPAQPHALVQRIPLVASQGDALPGSGAWSTSWTIPPGLAWRTLRFTAVVVDPEAAGGLARSNVLDLTFGP